MKWHLEDFRHFSSQQHLHKVTRPASFCLLQGHMPRNTCSFKHSHLDRHTITSPWCICTHSKYIHGASARIPYKAKEDSYVFIISTQIHRRGKNKARWTHGAKSSDGWQRVECNTEAKRLQRSRWQGCRFFLHCLFSSRCCMTDNPFLLQKCFSSLIKHYPPQPLNIRE